MVKNKKYINIAFIILVVIIVVTVFYHIKNSYMISNATSNSNYNSNSNKINITFFSSSKANLNKNYYEKTRELITKLNDYENKVNIIYGGGSEGIMGEVSKFKGNLISSNVKKFVKPNTEDEYTFNNIQERQKKLLDLADMFIVLPGGYGTFYELMEVLTVNDIGEANKPIILYNIDNFFDGFLKYLDKLLKEGFLDHTLKEINVHVLNDPDSIIKFITRMKH